MRLAWFSPWPPQPGDAAGRSETVTRALARRGFGIDVFVDESRHQVARMDGVAPPAAGDVRVIAAHDFVWRHARASYDLTVCHLADAAAHDFVWPYLFRWPGLVVLHDGRVHQARSRALLRDRRHDDYRAEFAWNHPDVAPAAAELAVNGYEGAFSCQWPMIRTVLRAARVTVTHAPGARTELTAIAPDRDSAIVYVAPGDGALDDDRGPERRSKARAALDLPPDAVAFGTFEPLSVDRRLPQILRAFAGAHARVPSARLVLAGPRDPDLDVRSLAASLGVADATLVLDDAGALASRGLTEDDAVRAIDVTLALRWPAGWDTPAPWLRALAAGSATVLLDLMHLADIPTLDPRTWRRHAPAETSARAEAEAVAVGIDVMDEEHSLRLALQRLAADAGLRDRLGRAGRGYWAARHAPDRMIDGYEQAIVRAHATPAPAVDLPRHLVPDPGAHARALAAPFGPAVAARLAGIASGDT